MLFMRYAIIFLRLFACYGKSNFFSGAQFDFELVDAEIALRDHQRDLQHATIAYRESTHNFLCGQKARLSAYAQFVCKVMSALNRASIRGDAMGSVRKLNRLRQRVIWLHEVPVSSGALSLKRSLLFYQGLL